MANRLCNGPVHYDATARDKARFWAKVRKSDGCWLWIGHAYPNGYGQFRLGELKLLAHRVAYAWFVGAIPDGLVVDHVKARGCTSILCVNPAHLEAVTQRENTRRSDNHVGLHMARTHCKHGHPLTGANLLPGKRRRGVRACRTCNRARDRDHWPARKARQRQAMKATG